MPVVALAVLSGAGSVDMPPGEFEPSAEQLAEYHAVYSNGDVKHLRVVFDRAVAGKRDGETRWVRGHEAYLGRKFIVMSRDPLQMGNTQITILFQGKADALFHALVYDRHTGPDRYDLRGFRRAELPPERVAWIAGRYRKFLEDPVHAM